MTRITLWLQSTRRQQGGCQNVTIRWSCTWETAWRRVVVTCSRDCTTLDGGRRPASRQRFTILSSPKAIVSFWLGEQLPQFDQTTRFHIESLCFQGCQHFDYPILAIPSEVSPSNWNNHDRFFTLLSTTFFNIAYFDPPHVGCRFFETYDLRCFNLIRIRGSSHLIRGRTIGIVLVEQEKRPVQCALEQWMPVLSNEQLRHYFLVNWLEQLARTIAKTYRFGKDAFIILRRILWVEPIWVWKLN